MSEEDKKLVDVIIPIFNGYSVVKEGLESVLKYFDTNARLILLDDCSTDPNIFPYLEEVKKKAQFPVVIHKNQINQGFVKTVNQGIDFSNENDVILLNSDTIVTRNWINKLRNAAYLRDNIATVTPLSNNATIFSIPNFAEVNKIPEGYDIDSFAQLVAENSLGLYPEVPTGHGFCLYIKRTAINLLGKFDEVYGRGCEEENDFCLRSLSHALQNIMADDTFIYHLGKASYSDETRQQTELRNREILLQRYPFYLDLIGYYIKHRPVQIWDNLQVKLRSLKVGLDGRCLNQSVSGTQKYLIELIKAYTAQAMEVELLISNGREEEVREILQTYQVEMLPHLIEEASLQGEKERWDIFHITFQGVSIPDLAALRPYTKRIVNTLQDFILAKNPLYFQKFGEFEAYNLSLKVALESVDGVIAISDFIKDQLLSRCAVSPERVKTVYHGMNRNHDSVCQSDQIFLQETGIIPKGYLLFVGNDFLHKNLEATVNVFRQVLKLGYNYQLVIVGETIAQGGSKQQLQEKLDEDITLKENIFFLNHVSDQELLDLYQNAGVLLYLSNAEGFGFPPLEAFANDCPVIASKLTSIPEVAGEGAIYFHPGEIGKIASTVIQLIEDEQERDRAIQKGRKRVQQFHWTKTATETIDFYYQILRLSPHSQQNLPSLYSRSQQLQQTETQLQQTQTKLKHTETQLQQTQTKLQHTETQLQQTQTKLQQTENELNLAYAEIEGMKSSKFWKLREKWFKVKSWLGLAKTE